jgi:chemotaxis protein CheX
MEQIVYQSFAKAAQNVMSSMAGLDIQLYKPSPDENLSTFVTGALGLTGDVTASIAISFTKEAIDAIHNAVFSDEKEISFSGIGDLVGEISNMIWGYARKFLSDKGLKVDASIPTVVLGDRQHLHSASGSVSKIMPFVFDEKKLFVEVTLRK